MLSKSRRIKIATIWSGPPFFPGCTSIRVFRLIFQEPGIESVKNFAFSIQGISYISTLGIGVILGLISYNIKKIKNK